MARGPKKHLKRINAPKGWLLSKLGGISTVRPSQGPHKLRESIPLSILLRHRLRYCLWAREVKMILRDREGHVRVNGRVRRDHGFPVGIMDILTIEKTGESFRLLRDVAGRFALKSIKPEEAKTKLCKVTAVSVGNNKVPYLYTDDGRTISYPHPEIVVHDTVKVDLESGKIVDHIKCEPGNLVFITGGNNIGRVGVMYHRERHLGGFDIIHVKDANGKHFSTRQGNIYVIGKGKKPLISVLDDQGLYLSALEKKQKAEHAHEQQH